MRKTTIYKSNEKREENNYLLENECAVLLKCIGFMSYSEYFSGFRAMFLAVKRRQNGRIKK